MKASKGKIRLYTTKERNIQELNNLLNRTYERTSKIRILYKAIRDEVLSKMKPLEEYNRPTYQVIYMIDNTHYKYHITKYIDDGVDSYGISNQGEIKLNNRNGVIDFLLLDDDIIKLGNRFHRIYNLLSNSTNSTYKVKKSLSKSIDKYLYDKYNALYKYKPENTIIIKIDDDKYCVKYDNNDHSYVISDAPIEIEIK